MDAWIGVTPKSKLNDGASRRRDWIGLEMKTGLADRAYTYMNGIIM
jgi:hypothetical protein